MKTVLCVGCVMDVSWSAAQIIITNITSDPLDVGWPGEKPVSIAPHAAVIAGSLSANPYGFMMAVDILGDDVTWRINQTRVTPDKTVLYRGTNLCPAHLMTAQEDRRTRGDRSVW